MIVKEFFKTGVKDIVYDGFISNKSVLEILEDIGCYHSDLIGYGPLDIPNTNRSWVLLEWQLQILKRPKYGEKLEVGTWVRNCTKIYTYRDFEIYNQKGEKCAIATSKWTWVDAKTGKIVRMDNEIAAKYGAEENAVFNEIEVGKIPEPVDFLNQIEYTVRRKDIDINNHMHNIYYIDLAEEVLPEDVYQKRLFNNLRITYRRGIKLGETICCKYGVVDGKNIIRIEDNEEKEKALVAMW